MRSDRDQTLDKEPRRESAAADLIAEVRLCLGSSQFGQPFDQMLVRHMAPGVLRVEASGRIQNWPARSFEGYHTRSVAAAPPTCISDF
jgi:hypothetical protein